MSLYTRSLFQGVYRLFTLPRLSLPLISSLGLTLAAVLAVVAIANTLLLQPLPDIKNEKNLYQVDLSIQFNDELKISFLSDARRVGSLQQHFNPSLKWGMFAVAGSDISVAGSSYPVTKFDATTGLIELLGLPLLQGKISSIENAEQGVWISEVLWQEVFHGRADILTQTITIDGKERPIFGVINTFTSFDTSGLREKLRQQIWVFSSMQEALKKPDRMSLNNGRMAFISGEKSSLPTEQQLSNWYLNYLDTEVPMPRFKEVLETKSYEPAITYYRESFTGDSRLLIMLLIIATGSLLLMACINLVNLFLAHYQSRNKEFSIQLCMGASLTRLAGLMFMENLTMFALATLFGVLSAHWLIELLPAIAGKNLPMLEQVHITSVSVLFGLIIVFLLNLLFSALSVLYINKNNLTDSLNSSGKGTPAQQKQGLNRLLMILQLVLACVLLTATSTSVTNSYQGAYQELGYSLLNAYEVQVGFNDKEWQSTLGEYDQYHGSELQQIRLKLIEQLSAFNGKVIDTPYLPLNGQLNMSTIPNDETGEEMMIIMRDWGANNFEAFDIELLAGRDLTTDDIDKNKVVVSKRFALTRLGEQEWPNLIGQEMKITENDKKEKRYTIVGIVEDVVQIPGDLNSSFDLPAVYFAEPRSRSTLNTIIILPEGQNFNEDQVHNALGGLDPRLGKVDITSMAERWSQMTESTRLNMYVVATMGCLTLGLAIIGLSGLSQMIAAQKRYELAVRQATGASQRSLLGLIIKDASWMLLIGLSLGFICAIGAYHYLTRIFEAAPAFDWMTTVGCNLILATIMLLSVAIPGWQVIRKDPMQALRSL